MSENFFDLGKGYGPSLRQQTGMAAPMSERDDVMTVSSTKPSLDSQRSPTGIALIRLGSALPGAIEPTSTLIARPRFATNHVESTLVAGG
eukprot:5769505-Prymnesium_polylepis.1